MGRFEDLIKMYFRHISMNPILYQPSHYDDNF